MTRSLLLLSAASAALAGCAGSGAPLVKDRYAKIVPVADLPAPRILVSATARPAPAAVDGIDLLDLSPEAQAELVKATGGKPPLRLASAAGESGVEQRDRLERRLVIALRPERFLPPGARLMTARIEIRPDAEESWRFVGWNRLEKDHEVVEVGRITTEDKAGFTGEIAPGIGGPLGTPKLGYAQSRQVNQEMLVRDDFIQAAAIDSEGRAWIDQRVGGGRDLASNTQFDATVAITGNRLQFRTRYALPPLYANDKPVPPASVRIAARTLLLPDPDDTKPICGIVRFRGQVRTIVRGARSYTEADDVIRLDEVEDSASFLLTPAPVEPSYALELDGLQLTIEPDRGDAKVLLFSSLEEVLELRAWLRDVGAAGSRIVGARLTFRNGPTTRPIDVRAAAAVAPRLLNAALLQAARDDAVKPCPSPAG